MTELLYNLKNQQNIPLGNLEYNPAFQVLSSNDETVALRFKINSVLFLLYTKRNQMVSRQELIDKVWAGNRYIGEKALTHTICKLRRTFKQLGSHELVIATIPKAGYSLQ